MNTYVIQNNCCGIRYFRCKNKWTDKIELAKRYETYKQAEKALNMMELFICESHKIIKIEDKDHQIAVLEKALKKALRDFYFCETDAIIVNQSLEEYVDERFKLYINIAKKEIKWKNKNL